MSLYYGGNKLKNTDINLSIKDATVNFKDGSPAGVVASASALPASGATGIYIAQDTGHWHWWDGTNWQDGGVYQAIELNNQDRQDLDNASQVVNDYFDVFGKTVTPNNFAVGEGKITDIGTYSIWTGGTNKLSANLQGMNLVGGMIASLPSYNTYKFAIGTNNQNLPLKWVEGGYVTHDVVLTDDNAPYILVVMVARVDGATISQADIDYININFAIKGGSKIKNLNANDILPVSMLSNFNKDRFLHFSFDDVKNCFDILAYNKARYTSIFNEPFLAKLKEYHEKYGAKFSLYVYYAYFKKMDNTFAEEFKANSDWLKIGLHIGENIENYNTASSYSKAKSDYELFIAKAIEVCGTANIIDQIPRLHNFGGNAVSLNAMKDTNVFMGCLTADDNRNSIYLPSNQQEYLRTHDKLVDNENNLVFFSTDMRLDWWNNFVTTAEYDVPVKDNPYDELVYRLCSSDKADMYKSIIVFTHEWQCYMPNVLNPSFLEYVEQVCQFANDYKIPFDYPMNRINGLVNQFRGNNYKEKKEISFDFANGGITPDGDITWGDSTTIRSNKPIYLPKNSNLQIIIPDGYMINIVTYTDERLNSNCRSANTDWQTTNQTISSDGTKFYVFILKKLDNSNINSSIADNYKFILIK